MARSRYRIGYSDPLYLIRWLLLIGVLSAASAFAQVAVRGRVANPHGPLRTPCENCHSTTAWRPIRTQPEFDHDAQTTFPLRGMHQGVACRSCHVGLVFSNTGTRCADCHADLHRRQFGANCQDCHTVQGWKTAVSAVQQHNRRFPLIGAHAVAPCDACHRGAASGVYTGASTQCVSCHLRDYQGAPLLNHQAAKLPVTCENCHSIDRWQGARFNHAQFTQFGLTGAHAGLECSACHVGGRTQGTPADCFGCHVNDFTRVQNPNHAAAGFSHDCATCHTNVTWTGANFDHGKRTPFALTGTHTSVACAQCHVAGRFAGTPMDCVGCHLANFEKSTNPNHRQGGFPTACDNCHTTTKWQGAKFDHSLGRFALTGAHTTVACAQCHVNGTFAGTPMQCAGCHLPDFQKAATPNHITSGFPQDCALCHATAQWQGARFDHNTATKFVLTGTHTTATCAECHSNGVFAGTTMQCAGCHLTDFQKTTNPNHATEGFSQDCATCHTTVRWQGASFNHNKTQFPLTGTHLNVSCALCHVYGRFAGTPTDCAGCHLPDFQKTTNPSHTVGGFPRDCMICHTTVQWQGAKFDHAALTRFALTGAHTTTPCSQCHANGVLAGTPMQCVGCHLTDFQKTAAPNHIAGGFPQDCVVCHTTARWQGAKFDHSKTAFPLTGAHTNVLCAQCHVNGKFAGTNAQCSSCHVNDYNGAANPNHKAAGFPQDCSGCHNTTQFKGATFNHATTGFALTGTHATTQCAQCHVNGNFSLTNTACATCHLNDYNGTTSPNHKSAGFPLDCSGCHNTTQFKGATFNHATTGFALTGTHATTQCAQCHVNGNFSLTSTACATCHLNDYNGTTSPNHKTAGFPQDCSGCHNTTQFKGAAFTHTATGFALTGAHATTQCAQCHVNGNFSLTSTACGTCHLNDYNGTTSPNHKSAGFPLDCSACHNTTQFKGATFSHATTGFSLTGAHVTTQCAQCHVNGNFSLTSTACATCHLNDYNGTTSPNHKTAGFPQDCSGCHNTTQFKGATFNHATTGFSLTGAHVTTQCAQCHANSNFSLTSTACGTCHLNDYNGTTSPNHKTAGFPQDCSGCHNTTQFKGATFNHAATGFALTGFHTGVQCAQCHVNSNYSLTSTACATCHLNDYKGANAPPHQASGFPQDCAVCHTTAQWMGARFDHATTGFALTGFHTGAQCAQCHVNNNYSLTSTACATCHLNDYNGANAPPHKSGGFPQDCTGCHNTTQWMGATFNHATTGFALTGTHGTTLCAQCHVNSNFSLTSAACINCHLTNYNNTTTPNHKNAGFPQDCSGCHNTTNWSGAAFNHTTTGFALTGFHTSVQCAQCHVNNNYSLTSTACATCHLNDYNGANAPPHKTGGFPQDCSVCHTTTQWMGATFNHTTTGFALTGTHTTTQCAQCHVNNNFGLTSAACANCHLTNYNGTTTPNHKNAGFPQDCSGCHNTTNWAGATFNHATTGFALTGFHTSVQCAQCHVNNNYGLTSTACATCHLNDYNGANAPPHKASGFPQDCTGCHNTTQWMGATFNHAATGFTLTGFHTSVPCAQCHVNNNFNLTSTACVTCHLNDYNGANAPPHKASGFPQDCTACHNTTQWMGATFNHATTGFTLTGFHTGLQCAQCHVNNNFNLTSTACVTCHLNDYNGANAPPHKTSGFPQDCTGCHNTTQWMGATFSHAATGFALTGTHTTTPCAQCHVNNNYGLTSAACANCHLANYNNTTTPKHSAAGFPQDCSICHSTTNWAGATFKHPTTPFALTGAHPSLACTLCHVNNVFTGTPTDCYSCHKTQYQSVSNPNHAAASFPTTCATCHTTTAWTGATFNHTQFPIYNTGHAGRWTTCADCHANSANYTVFSCIMCHQHSNQASVTSNHSGVRNFVYNGTSCYSCHPQGRAD